MYIQVNGHTTYAYSAGKTLDAAKPTTVFIHGVLNDHSVWLLQSRYLANHGFNVLAIDLPGHGKSAGSCPRSVEDAASFTIALLEELKVLYRIDEAALVGHSWGALIAMHAASLAPKRVTHLAMLATAYPMKVSPALLHSALHTPLDAINMVNTFSHSRLATLSSSVSPDTARYGGSKALMRRVLRSNPRENVLHLGLMACNQYDQGFEAFSDVKYSKLAIIFIVGRVDRMTPLKAAQGLISAAPRAEVVVVEAGHQLMREAPDEVLAALGAFLKRPTQNALPSSEPATAPP